MQKRIRKALFNSFAGKAVEASFSLLAAILLARLLGPDIIGIFALAMVFIGFSRVLSSLGTSDAVIRTSEEELSQSLLSSIFWLNFLAGLVLSVFFYLIATLTGDIFFTQGSADVIGKLCWVLVLSALINVPNALLEREIKFEKIFCTKLIAHSCSTIVAIFLALRGWGLGALIAQQYCIISLSLFFSLYFARWSPAFVLNGKSLKSVMSFSTYLTLAKVVNYFTKQGDIFLLGFFSSSAMVGIYSRGYQLTTSSLQLINGSIIKVFYPVISASQHDHEKIWQVTIITIAALSAIYSFIFWIIYFYSDEIVMAVLGADWILVAQLLPIFCIITYMLGTATVFSQILKALGRGALMLKVTLVCSSITIGFFYVGVHFGILGLAFGYMCGSFVLYLSVLLICVKLLNGSFTKILCVNFLCGFIFFLIGSFTKFTIAKLGFSSPLVQLGAFLIFYLLISLSCLYMFYKNFLRSYDFSLIFTSSKR